MEILRKSDNIILSFDNRPIKRTNIMCIILVLQLYIIFIIIVIFLLKKKTFHCLFSSVYKGEHTVIYLFAEYFCH
jgi:hypothetical protein